MNTVDWGLLELVAAVQEDLMEDYCWVVVQSVVEPLDTVVEDIVVLLVVVLLVGIVVLLVGTVEKDIVVLLVVVLLVGIVVPLVGIVVLLVEDIAELLVVDTVAVVDTVVLVFSSLSRLPLSTPCLCDI